MSEDEIAYLKSVARDIIKLADAALIDDIEVHSEDEDALCSVKFTWMGERLTLRATSVPRLIVRFQDVVEAARTCVLSDYFPDHFFSVYGVTYDR